MEGLADKAVIVTGGGGVIGRAICRRFAHEGAMEENFAIDEAFLATCTKPGLIEIITARPGVFPDDFKPAGKTMTVLRAAILEAAEDGQLDGYVPRECRFGSAEQLERLGQG